MKNPLCNVTKLPIIHTDKYVCELPAGHRFPIPKFQMIKDCLISDNVVKPKQIVIPDQVTVEEACTVHDYSYVNKFFNGQTSKDEQRITGFPWSPGLVQRVRFETGGTILALRAAMERGLACSTAGGTHHAFASRGTGFCLINDLAVAARVVAQMNLRVLIIDLDVHQGDGTAKIFEDDDTVFTFSVHSEKNFPFRKQRSNLDVGLPNGVTDRQYLQLLMENLEKVLHDFRPELVLYDAGVDPHEHDELGLLKLTDSGLFKRDYYVFDRVLKAGIPVASVIGGGYQSDLNLLARRHTIVHRAATKVWSDRGL